MRFKTQVTTKLNDFKLKYASILEKSEDYTLELPQLKIKTMSTGKLQTLPETRF
jgi:hypothetical protein